MADLMHFHLITVSHQRGVHNYVIQQTMCERNCTKNFTVRGSAQCMRRCAIPSPARRREQNTSVVVSSVPEEFSKINTSLESDNNLSDSNAIGSTDELLVTNESTAAHLIYREIFDASNNSRGAVAGVVGGGGSNLLERSRGKKNGTITKDLYSPLKNGPYYIESRTKRPLKSPKIESEILEYGQKLVTPLATSTEKSKITPVSSRSVSMPRNLVASHRRGMLNFKSSLVSRTDTFKVPAIVEILAKPAEEDARTEETRVTAAMVTVQSTNEPPPVPYRRVHGILIDLPPSTIQLDIRGTGGFEKPTNEEGQMLVTETTENTIQDLVENGTKPAVIEVDEAITKNLVLTTEKLTNLIETTKTLDDEIEKEATTVQPLSTENTLIASPAAETIPSISVLFPNIFSVPSGFSSNETEPSETRVALTDSYASIQRTKATESPPRIAKTITTTIPSTTEPLTIYTTAPTLERSTTERVPYKPSPSRGYKPSTQKPSTTLRPLIPKRIEITPSSIDTLDFRRTTPLPIKRYSPRPKKTSTTTTPGTSTATATSTTVSSSSTTESAPKEHSVQDEKRIASPPNTSFESIFNLSSIFPKFPKVEVTTESPIIDSPENTTVFATIPSKSLPDPDSILLQHNTDVTIELQRMNMATYVLAGLGMFPIVIIILYVIKTIVYNKQLKNSPQAVPVDSFVDKNISPVVMKTDGSSEYEDDILKEVELTRKNLRFKSILGEGNFGQVWKAEADDLPGHLGTTRIVAVKTERPEHGSGGLKQEAEIMFKLGSHPNVVTLLGCCVQEEPHLLIMEFAMRGRLLSLLRAARNAIHSMGGHVGTTRSSAIPLSPRRLSGFAHDIARGMEYITSKNVSGSEMKALIPF